MDKKTPQWNSSHPLDPIDTKTIFFIAGVRRRNLSLSLSFSGDFLFHLSSFETKT